MGMVAIWSFPFKFGYANIIVELVRFVRITHRCIISIWTLGCIENNRRKIGQDEVRF